MPFIPPRLVRYAAGATPPSLPSSSAPTVTPAPLLRGAPDTLTDADPGDPGDPGLPTDPSNTDQSAARLPFPATLPPSLPRWFPSRHTSFSLSEPPTSPTPSFPLSRSPPSTYQQAVQPFSREGFPTKGPEPNPHPERPLQPTLSPRSAPSLPVPTDLTSDDDQVLDTFFSITIPRIKQPHSDEEVTIPTEGARIKDDLEGATEPSIVERTVTQDATERSSKGKSLPAGHLSGNTLPDPTVVEDVARESDCAEEAVVEEVICKRMTPPEEELAVPTYGPVTQEVAGSHSMAEDLVTTRGAFDITSPSSSKSQVVDDPSSWANPLPTPLYTVKPTHFLVHRVEGHQPEQRLETLLPPSQTCPPEDTPLVFLPLAHEIPAFDASLSAASVYKPTTNSDRRLAPPVIPKNLPTPEAECATSQPVTSDAQLSDAVLQKFSKLDAQVNHLYQFTRQLATVSRPVFEAVSSHEMTLQHVQSSLSKIRKGMDVMFNSDLPGRARTPPNLIPSPHDLYSRFPSLNDRVFDGTLPADDLGVYIAKPSNRSVELRPAGFCSGLKAAHGTTSGSPTKGIDHPTTAQRQAEAVLDQEDEEEVPVGLTRLLSPPLSCNASLLATRTARAAVDVKREPESGRINKAPDVATSSAEGNALNFVSAANFSNVETSSLSKHSYATKGPLALRLADTSNQPTASVAENPLESETDHFDLELSDDALVGLMAFGQSLPVQSPNLLLTSNLAEPADPNLFLTFKPTSFAPPVRSNQRKIKMLLSSNKQSSSTKPSPSPIPSSAKSYTVSTTRRNGGISGASSETSSSKSQSEPPSSLQQSSPATETTAKSSLLKMCRNPYAVAVREEPPRKRRRTERRHGIPGRLERLLVMSNGRRIIKESVWPKFPKGWNTWRMLKQEVQCDGCNGRLHYPCAGLTLDVLLVESPFYCPDCQYLIAADREDEILPGPADRCVRHDCCRRRKQKMEVDEMDDEEYFIKRVIGRRAIGRLDPNDRNSGRVFEYLVEWEGYDMEDSTWEPAGHIHQDKDGNRPYVDSFLSEAKRAEVKLRLRVAMLPESQILAVWDPLSGEKRNKKGKAKATNRESGEEDDSY